MYLVLNRNFISSIICKYAIQPLGCNVLVIKLSIYLSTNQKILQFMNFLRTDVL